ncbi:MAG: hypothetical protein GXY70_02810 [Euryarchaeota archaeon]|nr:hypothetical protein [Euryarchaeota archaeon]
MLDPHAVPLIGLLPHPGAGMNCGACGMAARREMNAASFTWEFPGPNRALRLLDLGIALGSAIELAGGPSWSEGHPRSGRESGS